MTNPANKLYYDNTILKTTFLKFKTVWFRRTASFDAGENFDFCIPVDYLMQILSEDENSEVRTAFINKLENVKGFLGNKLIKRRLKKLPELLKEVKILVAMTLHAGETT